MISAGPSSRIPHISAMHHKLWLWKRWWYRVWYHKVLSQKNVCNTKVCRGSLRSSLSLVMKIWHQWHSSDWICSVESVIIVSALSDPSYCSVYGTYSSSLNLADNCFAGKSLPLPSLWRESHYMRKIWTDGRTEIVLQDYTLSTAGPYNPVGVGASKYLLRFRSADCCTFASHHTSR